MITHLWAKHCIEYDAIEKCIEEEANCKAAAAGTTVKATAAVP